MAVVNELIRAEADGSISFGNHTLAEKAKLEDFSHEGDLYKVKTLPDHDQAGEKRHVCLWVCPGTSVLEFTESEDGVSFVVEGNEDAQLTIGLQDDTEYDVQDQWRGCRKDVHEPGRQAESFRRACRRGRSEV